MNQLSADSNITVKWATHFAVSSNRTKSIVHSKTDSWYSENRVL